MSSAQTLNFTDPLEPDTLPLPAYATLAVCLPRLTCLTVTTALPRASSLAVTFLPARVTVTLPWGETRRLVFTVTAIRTFFADDLALARTALAALVTLRFTGAAVD